MNAYTLKDVLTKDGIENIKEIFNLILKNSFGNNNISQSVSHFIDDGTADNQDLALMVQQQL